MTSKIMVATDGSPQAGKAVDLAAELAAGLDADLDIVHVLMHGRPPAELQRMAEVEHMITVAAPRHPSDAVNLPGSMIDLMSEADSDVTAAHVIAAIGDQVVEMARKHALALGARRVKTHVLSGDFADEILDAAGREGVGMLVVGDRGLGRLQSLVLGSVSHKVAQNAKCSVVIAR